jgi:phage-related protein
MNEELKIIIKAVTKDAVKPIQDVKKELNGLNSSGKSASSGIGKAMKGVGIAAAAAVAAITAVVAALTKLGKAAVEFNREYSKLTTAFNAVGASTQTANEAYRGFYRFLGDSGKAVEAASHVAKLATGQESLAEWTNICQGVYATFGDSLPIEGLTEAANETLRVGKVTGVLADALNWAGVSEDEFNAKLAQTTSFEEREALLRRTLNGLYDDAARIYAENNRELMAYNESQAKVNAATAAAGQACIPLLTALNNLGASIMNALKPALDAIVPYIVTFVNWLAKGVETVMSFFSALTGKSSAVKTVSELGSAAQGLGNAAAGAGQLASGLDDAAAAAKAAKRHLQGFDELNVLQSGDSGSGGGASAPGYSSPTGGYFDNASFKTEVQEGESTMSDFVEKLKEKFAILKDIFAPTIEAWTAAFAQIKQAWNDSKQNFVDGATSIWEALQAVNEYILAEFVPNIVNSFSVNLAPVFADVLSLAIKEAGKTFKWFGDLFNKITHDIILPAMKLVEKIVTGTFEAIGNSWKKHGGELVTQIEKACENIRQFFTNLYEQFIKPIMEKVIQVLERVWVNGLQPLVQRVSDFVLRVGTLLLKLYNETIAPIVNWLLTYIYPIVVDVINNILDILGDMLITISDIISSVLDVFEGLITFLVGVFTLDFEMAWDGIKMFFQGIWDTMCGIVQLAWDTIRLILEPVGTFFKSLWEQITNIFAPIAKWFGDLFTNAWNWIKQAWKDVGSWFTNLWNGIKNVWNAVGSWFASIFATAWTGIKNAWSSVTSWFTNIWTTIKNVFSPVANWFKTIFTNAWTDIKNVFSNWGTFFSGLWDKIKNTFKGLGTTLGDAIGGAVKSGLNKVISWIESTVNKAINLINGAIRLINKLPGVSVGTIPTLSLPRLAKGGIVDSATIAMIGEAGKEAVLPLENNTQWMDTLADKIAARNGAPSQIVLKVGEREIGWASINGINQITKQTGELQLVLC